ncbi:MAG: hypothetical protein EYC70_00775 [Planctomycetota bacterium]|nr:MAG: hypothetical protein EYC70_00775 [Planctomycetota bacterium]
MRFSPKRLPSVLALLAVPFAVACSGGGGGTGGSAGVGQFKVLNTNLEQGLVWELNRPIRVEFNHALDPSSISFSSVTIRPLDQTLQGRPVTGSFELEPGSGNRVLVFRPTCPTNSGNDNGGLVPGGYLYEFNLPTQQHFGITVLRDTAGRPLSLGLNRRFRTPNPPGQPLFLDPSPAPPSFAGVEWPAGLNLYTAPDPLIRILIDQPIDGGADNLSTDNVFLLYAAGEIGTTGENDFPDANLLPGRLVLGANCTATGAELLFQISGLLPANRRLRLVMENTFRDLAGQTNVARLQWSPDHETPSLGDLYDDPTWQESELAVDEYRETFDSSLRVAGSEELSLPPAEVADGKVTAGFDFPGRFVSEDADVLVDGDMEIFTDGNTVFTDSNGKTFTVQNGVLYVDDFRVMPGRRLRGRGRSPLVIYATGNVTIEGTLDASGNHSHWPTSLNSPQFPEGGALGECGGGQGGDASQITTAETPRGEAGDGPFGLLLAGGGGGEGGFNQEENLANRSSGGVGVVQDQKYKDGRLIVGGGAGGTFTMLVNPSIVWTLWTGVEDPPDFDNAGPDHNESKHPGFNEAAVRGGENGMRGSSFESRGPFQTGWPEGVYGMEDESVDTIAYDGSTTDPAGFNSITWQNVFIDPGSMTQQQIDGDPTAGPDAGITNRTIFSFDPAQPEASTRNDFWGRRVNQDGTVTVGELLAPWAGYGGGAGGDMEVLRRTDPVSGTLRPIRDLYPDVPFRTNSTWYYKGAPGGGGAGQLLILAIGTIKIGAGALIKANGGIGHGAESDIYTYNQVSGSGGGSGGHIVIHSASKLDLSAIDLGSASNAGQVPNLTPKELVQALGGRRGWSASDLSTTQIGSRDGNGDYMIGRGGAGGPGLITWMVPNPLENIVWNNRSRAGIDQYIRQGDGSLDPDKLEFVLDLYSAPKPFALIPFFSSTSQAQSTWIDTGLASLRLDPQGLGQYPDWSNSVLRFQGVNADGDVLRSGGRVTPLGNVASGSTGAVSFGAFELNIPGASSYFAASFLRTPGVLLGYEVVPRAEQASAAGFEIVAAEFDRAADSLRLTTRTSDGPMSLAVGSTWAVRAKFFRVETSGLKDGLPNSTNLVIEFQGADDPDDLGTIEPGPNDWTADLSLLRGKRFVRWRMTFDLDNQDIGVTLNSPRPSVDYLKIPFVW